MSSILSRFRETQKPNNLLQSLVLDLCNLTRKGKKKKKKEDKKNSIPVYLKDLYLGFGVEGRLRDI